MVEQLARHSGPDGENGRVGLGVNEPDAVRASAAEFVLEGLYAHRRISRNEETGFAAGERKRRDTPEREEGSRPQKHRAGNSIKACSMKSIRYSKYTGDDLGIERRRSHEGALRLLPRKRISEPILWASASEPAHAGGSEERPCSARWNKSDAVRSANRPSAFSRRSRTCRPSRWTIW